MFCTSLSSSSSFCIARAAGYKSGGGGCAIGIPSEEDQSTAARIGSSRSTRNRRQIREEEEEGMSEHHSIRAEFHTATAATALCAGFD